MLNYKEYIEESYLNDYHAPFPHGFSTNQWQMLTITKNDSNMEYYLNGTIVDTPFTVNNLLIGGYTIQPYFYIGGLYGLPRI